MIHMVGGAEVGARLIAFEPRNSYTLLAELARCETRSVQTSKTHYYYN